MHKCPNCETELHRKYPRRQIFTCPKCDNTYKLTKKRKPRSNFDISDSSTWTTPCLECGKKMEYGNYAYHCINCGNFFEV